MSEFDEKSHQDSETSKSKSRVKREMHELQKLGERLITLNTQQLQQLVLPDVLHKAIVEAKLITSNSAKRRQFQYIGRLMRSIEDPSFIIDFFRKLDMKDQRATAHHHMLEAWRERLISDDADALTEFLQTYPNADRQHLRQLISNSKKEKLVARPVGALKALFRYIRELKTMNEEF